MAVPQTTNQPITRHASPLDDPAHFAVEQTCQNRTPRYRWFVWPFVYQLGAGYQRSLSACKRELLLSPNVTGKAFAESNIDTDATTGARKPL